MNLRQMNTMLQGYVESALWAESFDETSNYDANGFTRQDLEPSAAGYMARDVERFVASLDEHERTMARLAPGTMGHYLWLTKQRHGDGFWASPGTWEGKHGSLTEKAHALGECYLYLTDDGKIGLAQ